jgi:hypothetical protein
VRLTWFILRWELTLMLDSFDNSYITWINDGKQAWTLMGAGMGPDPETQIQARPVPQEPMVCLL